MPARREYSPEELAARLMRERELARVRMRRLRERMRVLRARQEAVRVTPIKEGTVTPTPLQTSPYGERLIGGGARGIEAVLAPFESRGYRHDPTFWAKMAGKYPGVDPELEAMKLAEWLEAPKNAKQPCSKARIDNWLKKAAADANSGVTPPPAAARTGYPNAPYAPPISRQGRNPGPADLPLFEGPVQRIDPGEMARFVAARRDVPLADKLARRNGRTA